MIQVGMLWFDDNPQRSLAAKIELAAKHYQEKRGCAPNVCYVHPGCLGKAASSESTIRVVALGDILPHHFWLGVAEEENSSECSFSSSPSMNKPSARPDSPKIVGKERVAKE